MIRKLFEPSTFSPRILHCFNYSSYIYILQAVILNGKRSRPGFSTRTHAHTHTHTHTRTHARTHARTRTHAHARTHTHTHTHTRTRTHARTHIYIYIYIHRERERLSGLSTFLSIVLGQFVTKLYSRLPALFPPAVHKALSYRLLFYTLCK